MKVIWKYPLPAEFAVGKQMDTMIELPADGRVVHTEVTDTGRIVVWIQFTVAADWDGRTPTLRKCFFRRVGTGHLVPDRYHHCYTYVDANNDVWHVHVFEDDPNAIG